MKQLLFKTFAVVIIFLACGLSSASQDKIDDHAVLGDLKTAKGVFLIDIGDAKKLNFYLEVVQESKAQAS